MKISDVTITLFSWDGLPSAKYSLHTTRTESDLGLLRIVTDEGLEGYAFLGTSAQPASVDAEVLIRNLKPALMGQDPFDRERLYQLLWQSYRRSSARTIGACDVALWDLAAKSAGMPLYKFLGAYRSSIPAYASSNSLGQPERYAADAVEIKGRGYHGYKIHPPREWRQDIVVSEAVRKAVGDDYLLMLDSTWSYDYDQALRVGRAIEELNYYWFEDPLRENDVYGYVKLRNKLDIPLMATEHPFGNVQTYVTWLTAGATDFLRGDVAVKGGITTMMKTAHLAEAFGMRYEVHHGGNSLNNFANLHVSLAIRNTEFMEVLLPDQVQKYGIVDDLSIDSAGFVHAPTAPGLGATIDFDLIKRKTIAVLS